MSRLPKIADVQLTRIRFEPGDRAIVRVHDDLDRDQKRRLLKAVQRCIGPDVEILLVDVRKFDIEVEKACRSRLLTS